MAATSKSEPVDLTVGGRTVRITNPARVYFSARGETTMRTEGESTTTVSLIPPPDLPDAA